MKQTADVVVVGAGAVGSACAYYLAEAGLKVTLVEREAIASGSSTHATGFLSLPGGDFKNEAHLRLGIESCRLAQEAIPVLQDLTGVDILFQVRPFLRPALNEADEEVILSQDAWQQPFLNTKWISAEDVRQIEPRLSPEIRGAIYWEGAQHLDSARYTLALAMAAEKRGVEILLRRVVGLLREGDRVTGVRYPGGEISAGAVVLAMGPWGALASPWLGFEVPVRPLKGERLKLKLDQPPLSVLILSPSRGHMISRRDGFLSVGSTAGRDTDDQMRYLVEQAGENGFTVEPTEAALRELLQRAMDMLPAVEEADLVEQPTGVRPLSPDSLPLLGPVPGNRGVYLAVGHGTKGIHLASGSGKLIADLVTRGRTDLPVMPEAFDPARFLGKKATFAIPETAED